MKKRTFFFVVMILFLMISVNFVVAQKITAGLQGAKMVLSAKTGETVERYILVINKNDISVKIDLKKSGDLVDNLKIKGEESFELAPGEERKVYFTIKADEPGTTETRINVLFTPPEGNGVGLLSEITLIASGEKVDDAEDDIGLEDETNEENSFSFNPSGRAISDGNESKEVSAGTIALLSTAILAAILATLFLYSMKKRGARRPSAK